MNGSHYLILNNLNEEDANIIKSIIFHIEQGHRKVGIRQIADENFVSTAHVVRLCKKLGFEGYSELFYHLLQPSAPLQSQFGLESLLHHYQEEDYQTLAACLTRFRDTHVFAIGEGFATQVADYIVQRLAVCGFMIFNKVHLYDFMTFRDNVHNTFLSNVKPSFVIAISQSGETRPVLDNVLRAKEQGFKLLSFSRVEDSTLAHLSDVSFIVEPSRQNLIGAMPNLFFGKVMLAFELMISRYMKEALG